MNRIDANHVREMLASAMRGWSQCTHFFFGANCSTLIGAVPVSVSELLALLKSVPPLLVMAKLAAMPANWERRYVRRLAM